MLRYELDDKTRAAMAPHHRNVQLTIQVLANANMGAKVQAFNAGEVGIGKFEGGVRVNERQICIKRDYVIDDFRDKVSNHATPEEEAVVAAIERTVAMFIEDPASLMQTTHDFPDPLRAMLGEIPGDKGWQI